MARKSSVNFLMFFLAIANLFLLSCSDKPLFIELHSASSESNKTSSWDFSNATDYIYDPSKIELAGGKAQLKQVDQAHEGDDFQSGTHVGTYYDSAMSKVKLLDRVAAEENHVNSILPSKSSNLLGYWRFEDNLIDSSQSGLLGAAGGAPTYVSSYNGSKAIQLGGGGDFVSLPEIPYFTNPSIFTFSVWIYSEDSSCAFERIIDSVTFFLACGGPSSGQQGHMIARISNSSEDEYLYTDNVFPLNEWHHLVITYDGTTAYMYLDGIIQDDIGGASLISAPLSPSPQATLGSNVSGMSYYWDGYLDEVSIWSSYLSPEEVGQLYEGQTANFTELSSSWTPRYDKLVGYWRMDGNWQDSSGNGNHGTAFADASFDSEAKIGSLSGNFDGTGDYVDLGFSDLPSNDAISVATWIHPDNISGWAGRKSISYGGKNDRFSFWVENNNRLYIVVRSNGSSTFYRSGYIQEDQWQHIVFTYKEGEGGAVYIDSVKVGLLNDVGAVKDCCAAHTIKLGTDFDGSGQHWQGRIDDFAIWNARLTDLDVSKIYNRQKQKYAGHYDSPIIDLGAAGSWTNLNALTSLPFGKEIVAQSTENSSVYSALSGDLSDGLVGYWPLNETSANGVGGDDVEDNSTNSNNGIESGGVRFGERGVLNNSLSFDGSDDSVEMPSSIDPSLTDFSASLWFKIADLSSSVASIILQQADGSGTGRTWFLVRTDVNNEIASNLGHTMLNSSVVPEVGRWYNVTLVQEGTDLSFYIDGKKVIQRSRTIESTDGNFILGKGKAASQYFTGHIDEVAIWDRPLTPAEVLELYRRGANRIKYQVKSCVDSNCECKSFNTSPLGSANDCDGDGTLNSIDFDDIYKAEFVGPGGSGITAFSELFNRDSGDMTFTCNANATDLDNDICVDDEISLTGSPFASSPSFSFFDFPSSSRPSDNRYFQYRVMMEAEENTACSGEPCLPELTSVEVSPTGRYFAGSPSVVNKTSQPLNKALESLQVTNSSGCNMSYQVSNDGSSFYYWSGTSWVTGSDVSESNNLETLNNNIESFTTQVGLGDFFFRSFLGNSSFGECELDDLQINRSSD